MRRIYTNLLPIALFLVLAPTALASTTWYVDGVNGSDGNNCQTAQTACKTIGHAISLAGSGDSIIVAPATYTENLTIGLSLSVIGSGASTTIIDGNAAGRVVTIHNSSAQVTLSNITIRNGLAGGVVPNGGGIDNVGTLTINNTTVSGNGARSTAYRVPAFGGGINNGGTATINNSTISGNSAWCAILTCSSAIGGGGGGIANSGTLTINNSTLNGNIAGATGRGGGIWNYSGRVTINNSTISGNGQGGGIWNNSGSSVVLQNSIVASNSGSNCSGTMTSNGYNLSSDGSCNFNHTGDLNNHDPLLGPLQNNGGPTQTMALLSGSPAIDAGNPSGCTDGQGQLLKTDQRGQPRPDKEDIGGCDMGAFESQSD